MKAGRRWTIRTLLIGVNLSILLVPLGLLVFTTVFEAYLLRQTERQMIAESVVIGEIWRERFLAELAETARTTEPGPERETEPTIRPPGLHDSRFTPHRPVLDLGFEVIPERSDPPPRNEILDSPAARAGASLQSLVQRAQVFNLSGARVLDEEGCVVTTSGDDLGRCLDHQEEVREAREGRYSAAVRLREAQARNPPFTSLSRRSRLRVFTATPIFVDDKVAGIVRMSRTSVSPAEMLWAHRGKVLLFAGVVLLFTPIASYLFSHAISKPVRELTRAAESMAEGRPRREFTPGAMAPREVLILSRELNRMTRQLTEKSDYILEFASNVSHELKTPVTGITGAIELLQDEWEQMPEEQRRRFLDNIAGDAARIGRLATDLLRLARIESVREPDERIELGPFLEELARRYEGAVRIEPAESRQEIAIHRDHLETALHNLLDNAVRHGQGKPVELRLTGEDGRCVVRVRDQGAGISEANRPRLFDRFFTTERERGGTGLGLSIVKAIAESRGGSIDFRSGADGTEFRLVL